MSSSPPPVSIVQPEGCCKKRKNPQWSPESRQAIDSINQNLSLCTPLMKVGDGYVWKKIDPYDFEPFYAYFPSNRLNPSKKNHYIVHSSKLEDKGKVLYACKKH